MEGRDRTFVGSGTERPETPARPVPPIKEKTMSDEKKACEHPEKLKGKPEDCSPEQIRQCHGDVKDHPCVEPPAQK